LSYLKFNLIAFLQAFITFRGYCAIVNENIGSIFPADKSVSFGVVKPLYRAFQAFHLRPLGARKRSFHASRFLSFSGHREALSREENEKNTLVRLGLRLVSQPKMVTEPENAGDGFAIMNASAHHHADGGAKREEFDLDAVPGCNPRAR
jgi:hypothetical protein